MSAFQEQIEGLRVVHPLFSGDGDGSPPTSPLQLEVGRIDRKLFAALNERWHSRLPIVTNCFEGVCFGAEYANRWYAVAWWSDPVARALDNKTIIELRRMAIADDAPKNTASRFIKMMLRSLRQTHPQKTLAISYQDTEVHLGTIYKASGWQIGGTKKNIGSGWNTRDRSKMQSTADKIRWERKL